MNAPVVEDRRRREHHQLLASEVADALGTDPVLGLSAAEAARRLAASGPNEVAASRRMPAAAILAAQFKNLLVICLIAAALASAFLGHEVEAATIGAILVLSVGLGFYQEYRAERALEALRRLAAPRASVLRGGRAQIVASREIVPGDLVALDAGDRVAADARLIAAEVLRTDESALTGESTPVDKQILPVGDAVVADRTNMVYAGSAVVHGRGRGIVVATGASTEFGRIAGLLEKTETPRTPLQKNLDGVGRSLAWAGMGVVLAVFLLGLMQGRPLFETLVFGIALAVAVVPEALPAVVTFSLAIGVQRLAKRNALVRRLPAVETLGSTTMICSDKTGTLTKNEMTVRAMFVDGAVTMERTPATVHLLRAASICSDATATSGDPTERAIVAAAAEAGMSKAELDASSPRISEIPFSAERRRMTTLNATPGGPVTYSKGSPEVIVESCALDGARKAAILEAAGQLADRALRVIAVAARPGVALEEHGMAFLGLLGLQDPPRPEAKAAIEACRLAGIRPVMITGDHPATATAIARELGLEGRVVTGSALEGMADAELDDVAVYARVTPAHKLRIVEALQKRGHVVAMTGDGVNDAPALKRADIGVAMGRAGTDVAREAAAMTLTDDNFASIVAAVEEGRAVFANIRKYLMYLLSSNIGEIGLFALAALAGLPMPLAAVQILYVNLATDGLPAMALALDPVDPLQMRRKPRNPGTGVFEPSIVMLMLAGGAWSALVNLGLFVWALSSGRSAAEATTMVFVSLILIQFFKAYSFRSDRESILHRPFANRWLNAAVAWEIGLLALILNVPWLERIFGVVALGWMEWVAVAALAFSVVPVLELAKRRLRRGI